MLCLSGDAGVTPRAAGERALPPCVSVLRNAWLAKEGTALVPPADGAAATALEIAGGCCGVAWLPEAAGGVPLPEAALAPARARRGPVVLNLAHPAARRAERVVDKLLPEYLAVLPLVEAVPEMRVLIDDCDRAEALLVLLGLDPRRILRFDDAVAHPQWTYAAVAVYPPLVSNARFFPLGFDRAAAVAAVLRGVVAGGEGGGADAGDAEAARGRRTLVLARRETGRDPATGGCAGEQCVEDFEALRAGLDEALGAEYEIVVFGALDGAATAVRAFSRAAAVVGFHDSAFRNLVFCDKNTIVVHIASDLDEQGKVDTHGLRYHLARVDGIGEGSTDAVLDVEKLTATVAEALVRDGVPSGSTRQRR